MITGQKSAAVCQCGGWENIVFHLVFRGASKIHNGYPENAINHGLEMKQIYLQHKAGFILGLFQ